MRLFLACFIVIPIVEMWVLIEIGSQIGALYTVLLVLLTAIIGVNLLRAQGLSTLLRVNQKMQTGEIPLKELAEGFMLAIAGALLLTPGFVTDGFGFLLLTPGFRQWFGQLAMKKMMEMNSQGSASFQYYSMQQNQQQPQDPFSDSRIHRPAGNDVIDAEYERVDKTDKP